MPFGCAGRILLVDRSTGQAEEMETTKGLARNLVGGAAWGSGWSIRSKRAACTRWVRHPGLHWPTVSTRVPRGARSQVVGGNSPLSQTWGDASSDGDCALN